MSVLRLVITWIVMAVLPLQGFAAASMLMCGQGAASMAAVHEQHAGHDQHHGSGVPDADSHGHAHAAHGLVQDKAQSHAQADSSHACDICASCCHTVALSEAPSLLPSADVPSADLPQPQLRLPTRVSPRPDKPPRA